MVIREFHFRKAVNTIDTIELPKRKYQVVAYSSDARTFLYYCTDKTSSLTKLLNVAIDSFFARVLFFLDYDRIFREPFQTAQRQIFELKAKERMERLTSLYSIPSASIIIPLYKGSFDESVEAIKKCDERSKESVRKYHEVAALTYDVFSEAFESAIEYYVKVLSEKVASDPEYVRKIRYKRKKTEFEAITSEVMKRVAPKFEKRLKEVASKYRRKFEELPSTWFARTMEHYQRL